MRKLAILAFMPLTCGMALAQDTYDAARFASSDLNGTARFVGMGGALGALGGDISVMSTNPAGTAMFRRNDVAITLSGLFTDQSALGHDKARMSLDNAGVVIAIKQGNRSGLKYVNFGVNYVKKQNFLSNTVTNIDNLQNTFSQTYQIAQLANESYAYNSWGILAYMAKEGILYDNGEGDTPYYGNAAQSADYRKATYGSQSQTDINLSFNVSDQFFFGASIGLYDIDYKRETYYAEVGTDNIYYDFSNWYETSGDGYDFKLGAIVRPFDNSPFRIGVFVHTPTWYHMTDQNGATLYVNDNYVDTQTNGAFDYTYRTPWKLGVSLGHTVGNYLAVGAEYEYSDLSTAKYYMDNWELNPYFRYINSFTSKYLKGQHTLKLGLEYKPTSEFSVRFGYNYVSSPYEDDAYRYIPYDSYSTETDFTNWKAINRFTVGLGYRHKKGYIDVTYQYSAQKGDLYAFYEENQSLIPTEINNDRSQLMCTFGFKF